MRNTTRNERVAQHMEESIQNYTDSFVDIGLEHINQNYDFFFADGSKQKLTESSPPIERLTLKKEFLGSLYLNQDHINETLYQAFCTKRMDVVEAFIGYINDCNQYLTGYTNDRVNLDFSYKPQELDSIAFMCLKMNDEDLFKLAINNGANCNETTDDDLSLLHYAVIVNKSVECTKSLLEKGALINVQEKNGSTPLIISITSGTDDLFNLLIQQPNIDVNIKSNSQENSLSCACRKDNIDYVRRLLERGAEVNCHNISNKHSPLSYAVQNNNLNMVELLIDHNADTKYDKVVTECMKLADDNPIKNRIISLNIEEKPWQNEVQNLMNYIEQSQSQARKPKGYLQAQSEAINRIFDIIRDKNSLSHLEQQGLFHQVVEFGNNPKFISFLKEKQFNLYLDNQDKPSVLQCCVRNQHKNQGMLVSLLDNYSEQISKEDVKATLLNLVTVGNKESINHINTIGNHNFFPEKFCDINREEVTEFAKNLRKENKNPDLKRIIADIEKSLSDLSPKKKKPKNKVKKHNPDLDDTKMASEDLDIKMSSSEDLDIKIPPSKDLNSTASINDIKPGEIKRQIQELLIEIEGIGDIKRIAKDLGQAKESPTTSPNLETLDLNQNAQNVVSKPLSSVKDSNSR